MSHLEFSYYMDMSFDKPVHDHYFTLKCLPQDTRRQKVHQLSFEILPHEELCETTDGYGNRVLYGNQLSEHEHFSLHMQGMVETGLDICEEKNGRDEILFRQQSLLTEPGDAILALAKKLEPDEEMEPYLKCRHLMHGLYRSFLYKPGVTNVETSAEEAAALGKGVCQDYAHVMLSLCRLSHIPARYCTGLLLGEGLSHAWVEVCCKGYWYGMDPTNNLLVADQYIKIAHGRDASDCQMNQGIFTGTANQCLQINALVREDSRKYTEEENNDRRFCINRTSGRRSLSDSENADFTKKCQSKEE